MAGEARPTPEEFLLATLRAEVARLAAENVGLRQRLSDAEDNAISWREEAVQLRGQLAPHIWAPAPDICRAAPDICPPAPANPLKIKDTSSLARMLTVPEKKALLDFVNRGVSRGR